MKEKGWVGGQRELVYVFFHVFVSVRGGRGGGTICPSIGDKLAERIATTGPTILISLSLATTLLENGFFL